MHGMVIEDFKFFSVYEISTREKNWPQLERKEMCACVVCFPPQIVDWCAVKRLCTGETESHKTKHSREKRNGKSKGRQRENYLENYS